MAHYEIGSKTKVDGVTKASLVIDHPHHEIHEGDSFHAYVASISIGAEAEDKIQLNWTTPNTAVRIHMIYDYGSAGASRMDFIEAPTGGASGGSDAVLSNRDRNSATTSVLTVKKDASIATGGTLIDRTYIGAGTTPGSYGIGQARGESEWILKANTTYAIFLATSAAIAGYIHINWYEHTSL